MLGITSKRFVKFRQSGSLLTVLTVVGVIVGFSLGFGLKEVKPVWTPREVSYLKFVGELFLRTLQALVLPLIFCSLVDAIGSLDLTYSKKIGIRALLYYLSTTGIAAILGVILASTIQPGHRVGQTNEGCVAQESSVVDTMLDLVRNMFPSNLIGATLEGTKTVVVYNATIPFDQRKLEISTVLGTNMLGIVVFAIVLGLVLEYLKESGKPVLNFFKSMGKATMFIISGVVSFSPVAITFLIAAQLVEQPQSIEEVFATLAWYFATVVSGLLIHGVVILPLSYLILTRSSPLGFVQNMTQAMATAFGTASSSATLPVTMKCLEEKNRVDPTISRFVIPIGATVNMNGAALYLPVATIYIAQLCGLDLNFGQLISLSLVTIASAVGAAGIPHMAMVVLVTVLNSQGLPPDYVSKIIAVEWILDRLVTVVNILGDAYGAAIIAKMSRAELERMRHRQGEPASRIVEDIEPVDFTGTIPRVKVQTDRT